MAQLSSPHGLCHEFICRKQTESLEITMKFFKSMVFRDVAICT
jgi:hypothetical protein